MKHKNRKKVVEVIVCLDVEEICSTPLHYIKKKIIKNYLLPENWRQHQLKQQMLANSAAKNQPRTLHQGLKSLVAERKTPHAMRQNTVQNKSGQQTIYACKMKLTKIGKPKQWEISRRDTPSNGAKSNETTLKQVIQIQQTGASKLKPNRYIYKWLYIDILQLFIWCA